MMDIIDVQDGHDLILVDSDVMRAANVLQVQQGDLEYAPNWGVNTRQFLESPIRFQNSVILAHYLQRLAETQINIVETITVTFDLYQKYVFSVGAPPSQDGLQIEAGGQL